MQRTLIACGILVLVSQVSAPAVDAGPKFAALTLPRVEPLSDQPAPQDDAESSCRAATIVFVKPVGFRNRAGFDPADVGDRPSVQIYEGMKLKLFKDGRYSLYCTVEAPATTVTLNLDFKLISTSNDNGKVCYDAEPWATLTIPPIQIEPRAGETNGGLSRVYQVTYTGWSPRLKQVCTKIACPASCCSDEKCIYVGQPSGCCHLCQRDTLCQLVIQRHGKATIGSLSR